MDRGHQNKRVGFFGVGSWYRKTGKSKRFQNCAQACRLCRNWNRIPFHLPTWSRVANGCIRGSSRVFFLDCLSWVKHSKKCPGVCCSRKHPGIDFSQLRDDPGFRDPLGMFRPSPPRNTHPCSRLRFRNWCYFCTDKKPPGMWPATMPKESGFGKYAGSRMNTRLIAYSSQL